VLSKEYGGGHSDNVLGEGLDSRSSRSLQVMLTTPAPGSPRPQLPRQDQEDLHTNQPPKALPAHIPVAEELSPDARHSFTVTGYGIGLLKRVLGRLGWQEADRIAQAQLEWSSKRISPHLARQKPSWQLFNHFPNSNALGSKSCMLANLRRYCGRGNQWREERSAQAGRGGGTCSRGRPVPPPLLAIVPRSYDLYQPWELHAFLLDFTVTRAVAVLKTVSAQGEASGGGSRASDAGRAANLLRRLSRLETSTGTEPVEAAVAGLTHRSQHVPLLLPNEAALIFGTSCGNSSGCARPEEACATKESVPTSTSPSTNAAGQEDQQSDIGASSVATTLPRQQACLDGRRGLWLLKAPHQDCGRSVHVHQELVPLLLEAKLASWQMVVQKYIEYSLLINGGRKSDVRVWVLVSSWNPATAWIHPEPYFRLATKPLSFNQEALSDPFVHLTNRSVQKGGGAARVKTEDEDHILTLEAFFRLAEAELTEVNFQDIHGDEGSGHAVGSVREAWKCCTWPGIMQAVQTAVLACQCEVAAHPSGCFELFGFDFMLDRSWRPWLLEANSSPDLCEDAGPSLRGLIEEKLTEMLALVIALHEGTTRLPDIGAGDSWARDEVVEGSGRWRLCLLEAPQKPRNSGSCSPRTPPLKRQSLGQNGFILGTHAQVLRTCLGTLATAQHPRRFPGVVQLLSEACDEACDPDWSWRHRRSVTGRIEPTRRPPPRSAPSPHRRDADRSHSAQPARRQSAPEVRPSTSVVRRRRSTSPFPRLLRGSSSASVFPEVQEESSPRRARLARAAGTKKLGFSFGDQSSSPRCHASSVTAVDTADAPVAGTVAPVCPFLCRRSKPGELL